MDMGRVFSYCKKNRKPMLTGLLIGLCSGLFGAGGGMLSVWALERFCDFPPKKAHASTIGIIFPLSLISGIVYIMKESVDYRALILVTPGVLLGSFLGAKLMGRMKERLLDGLFSALMAVSALFLLFR